MNFSQLQSGVLVRRYKRFLADIELADKSTVTVHCPNTGAMTGCAEPGSRVWISTSANPKRKLPQTLELVETEKGLVCVHSARANAIVEEALNSALIGPLSDYQTLQSEVRYGDGTRVDFLLSGGRQVIYVEVKAVTLHVGNQSGAFPDAVSERAQKHLTALRSMLAQGHRAALVFCVLHEGIRSVAPADHIDPCYGDALRQCEAQGLEVYALATQISPDGIWPTHCLPVSLERCTHTSAIPGAAPC